MVEELKFDSGLRVPYANQFVRGAGGNLTLVCAQGKAGHSLQMVKIQQFLSVVGIPELHVLAYRANELRVIATEAQRAHRFRQRSKRSYELTAGKIPQLDVLVRPAGHCLRAVAVDRDGQYTALVGINGLQWFLVCRAWLFGGC